MDTAKTLLLQGWADFYCRRCNRTLRRNRKTFDEHLRTCTGVVKLTAPLVGVNRLRNGESDEIAMLGMMFEQTREERMEKRRRAQYPTPAHTVPFAVVAPAPAAASHEVDVTESIEEHSVPLSHLHRRSMPTSPSL